MRLYEGKTYWDKTVPNPLKFEPMSHDQKTGILIVGGGITGNICAYVLSALGLDVMIVDKDRIGRGSSLVNTGLLQYRSDRMLCELVDEIGEERAHLFYQMCLEAMDELTVINDLLVGPTGYRLKDSIYYASAYQDNQKLKREHDYLTKYGFPVEFLDRHALIDRYGIDKSCALRTWHDAEVNPYRFIQALTRKNLDQGVRYYENSELDLENIRGKTICTKEGHSIEFEHLVLTTGYSELYPSIKAKTIVKRTYAFCSVPLKQALWPEEVMIWETRMPYIYMRTTEDGRIIAGGSDEDNAELERQEGKILEKVQDIAQQIEAIFIHLDIEIEYAWNAIFCGSTDGLPFIGPDQRRPDIFYILGYEGNGVCYSMAGSLILKDCIRGKFNPYQAIVKIDRK